MRWTAADLARRGLAVPGSTSTRPRRQAVRRVITLPPATEHGHGRWEISIPGWQPTRLNVLLGSHFGTASKHKKADAAELLRACRAAGVTAAIGPRLVSLLIVLGPRQRAGDPDAYWKSLLDGLVRCGALRDDNRQWCRLGEVRFGRGEQATRVVIEDVPSTIVRPRG